VQHDDARHFLAVVARREIELAVNGVVAFEGRGNGRGKGELRNLDSGREIVELLFLEFKGVFVESPVLRDRSLLVGRPKVYFALLHGRFL
jgi:hypothetical protein